MARAVRSFVFSRRYFGHPSALSLAEARGGPGRWFFCGDMACFGQYGAEPVDRPRRPPARERTFRMESICFDRLASAADEPKASGSSHLPSQVSESRPGHPQSLGNPQSPRTGKHVSPYLCIVGLSSLSLLFVRPRRMPRWPATSSCCGPDISGSLARGSTTTSFSGSGR